MPLQFLGRGLAEAEKLHIGRDHLEQHVEPDLDAAAFRARGGEVLSYQEPSFEAADVKPEVLSAVQKKPDAYFISSYLLPWLLYMVLMEASAAQGTIGKMALGIKVTDVDGNRIGLLRALVRNLMKFVSSALLCIGYAMAGWTQKKQTLHDMAARCVLPIAR